MQKVKFTAGGTAVRCERPGGQYVQLDPNREYELVSQQADRRGTVIVAVRDPDETYLGGDDGKTTLPCTLRIQLPIEQVVVS